MSQLSFEDQLQTRCLKDTMTSWKMRYTYWVIHCRDIEPGKMHDLRSASVNNNRLAILAAWHRFHPFMRYFSQKLFSEVAPFVASVKAAKAGTLPYLGSTQNKKNNVSLCSSLVRNEYHLNCRIELEIFCPWSAFCVTLVWLLVVSFCTTFDVKSTSQTLKICVSLDCLARLTDKRKGLL